MPKQPKPTATELPPLTANRCTAILDRIDALPDQVERGHALYALHDSLDEISRSLSGDVARELRDDILADIQGLDPLDAARHLLHVRGTVVHRLNGTTLQLIARETKRSPQEADHG